jgi:hypothetical protein
MSQMKMSAPYYACHAPSGNNDTHSDHPYRNSSSDDEDERDPWSREGVGSSGGAGSSGNALEREKERKIYIYRALLQQMA